MLTPNDVQESPLALAVNGGSGCAHVVTVSRLKAGRVAISCDCATFAREGWCRPIVDLCCMRLRDCGITDPELDRRFVEIIAGTSLETAAQDADLCLRDHARERTRFDAAALASLTRESLDALAEQARRLSETAEAASDAIMRLQRKIAQDRDCA